MASYQHLNLVERAKIKTLQLQGLSIRKIAQTMGRSHSSLVRELKRNHQGHPHMSGYVPQLAHALAQQRKRKASQRPRLKSQEIRNIVHEKLKLRWTPEQIAAAIGTEISGAYISHEAIYQYIYTDYREGIALLARSHKQRYPRRYSKKSRVPKIQNRVDIEKRPEAINQRQVFGHWESDSIVSQSGKSAINVIVERSSRRVFINKVSDKTAELTKQAIIRSLLSLPPQACQSITYDNGSENYLHQEINLKLNMTSYFCKPYHSWEKGTVENTNELIRRYIPKKTNLDLITEKQLKIIESQLNARPRKCLGFQTPENIFQNYCASFQSSE